MPRPFVQLTPEPVVPVESGAAGGTPGVSIENAGTPIPNNPHTILNLTGGISATDAGSGVATVVVTASGGGFTDNANALRTRKNPWLRRLETDVEVSVSSLGLGTLNDYSTGPQLSCYSVTTVRDKFYFVGNPGGSFSNRGNLYVMDLYNNTYGASTYPLNNLGPYADAPVDLIGVAGLGNPDNGSGGDFIFALLPNLNQYQLGYAYTDSLVNPPGTLLYGNINAGTAVPGSVVRACYVAGGGGDPAFGTSGTYGPGFLPMFAISSTNGHIYLTDANSSLNDAINTNDTPGAMFVDNEGFLWAALTTSQKIAKYSIDYTNFTLAEVASYNTPGVTALDMIQDGRYARVLWMDNGAPQISAWQLADGTAGPSFPAKLSSVSNFHSLVDGYYDSTRDLFWSADQGGSTNGSLVAFDATTQATVHVLTIPSVPTNGQLPSTWTGVRRVIGDTTNVYAADASSHSPLVAIINQNSGAVVGLCQVSGSGMQARDIAVNGDNLYVVARSNSVVANSTVQRFSISSAISSYPTPASPLTTSATGAWHVICYDSNINQVFVGTNTSGNPPEILATLDPTTLATVNTLSFSPSSSFRYFFGLLSAFGSVWAGTASGSILRINPSSFPAGGSVLIIITSTGESQQLYADTTGNTICVSDFNKNVASRVSVGNNTEVSTIISPQPPYYGPPFIPTPSALWLSSFNYPNGSWNRYTTTVGSETLINTVSGYSTPFVGYTGRLGWDGYTLWLSFFQPQVGGICSPLTRLHPDTGELLMQITGTGYESTSYGPAITPRGFAIDTSGTVIAPVYNTTVSGVQQIGIIQPAGEDVYLNSIRSLTRPLDQRFGGREFGQEYVSGGSSYTLTPTVSKAYVASGGGSSTVTFFNPNTYGYYDWRVTVGDVGNNAATNTITVNGGGFFLEDPNAPGTFNTSVLIQINNQVVTWEFNLATNEWKIVSSNASGGGGGTVIGVPVGYILVGNTNPSTGTLDAAHLQAIVDTSAGVTTVNAPDLTLPATQQLFRVTDDTANAATNPITVQSQASRNIEDPNNHGHFATAVQITVNSQSIDWQWTGSHYKIV